MFHTDIKIRMVSLQATFFQYNKCLGLFSDTEVSLNTSTYTHAIKFIYPVNSLTCPISQILQELFGKVITDQDKKEAEYSQTNVYNRERREKK